MEIRTRREKGRLISLYIYKNMIFNNENSILNIKKRVLRKLLRFKAIKNDLVVIKSDVQTRASGFQVLLTIMYYFNYLRLVTVTSSLHCEKSY